MPLATADLAYTRLANIIAERNTYTPATFHYLELDSVLTKMTGQFNLRYPTYIPGAPPETGLFSDSFPDVDGVLNVAKWTVTAVGSGTSALVANHQALFTSGAVASYAAVARAVAIHTAKVHTRLRMVVTIDPAKKEQYISFTLRGDGVWAVEENPHTGYTFTLDTKLNKIYVRKNVSGVTTELAGAGIAFTWTGGTTYEIAVEAQGSALRFKAWVVNTTEPGAWTWTGTDSTITAAGVLMIAVNGGLAAVVTTLAADNITLTELDAPIVVDPTPPPDPGTGLSYTGVMLTLADVGPRSGLGGSLNNQTITTVGARTNQHYTGTTIVRASAAGSTFTDCQFDGYVQVEGQVTMDWCLVVGQLLFSQCSATATRCGVHFGPTDGLDFFRNTDTSALMNLFLRECVVIQDGTPYAETSPGSGVYPHGDAFQALAPDSIIAVGCVFDMVTEPTFGAGGVTLSGFGHTSAFNVQPGASVPYEVGTVNTYDCWFRGGSFRIYDICATRSLEPTKIVHTRPKFSGTAGSDIYRTSTNPGSTVIGATDWATPPNPLTGI